MTSIKELLNSNNLIIKYKKKNNNDVSLYNIVKYVGISVMTNQKCAILKDSWCNNVQLLYRFERFSFYAGETHFSVSLILRITPTKG